MNTLETVAACNEAYRTLQTDETLAASAAAALADRIHTAAPAYRQAAKAICKELVALTGDDPDYAPDAYTVAVYDALADTIEGDTQEEVSRRALRRLLVPPARPEPAAPAPELEPEAAVDVATEPGPTEPAVEAMADEALPDEEMPTESPDEAPAKLTIEEQRQADFELCRKVVAHDPEATALFVKRYERSLWKEVNWMTARMEPGIISRDDLFQEAVVYALEAAGRYISETAEYSKFMNFNSFLTNYLFRHLARVAIGQYAVRLPVHVQEMLNRIDAINRKRLANGQGLMGDENLRATFKTPIGGPGQFARISTGDIWQAYLLTRYLGSTDTGYSPGKEDALDTDYIMDERRALSPIHGEAEPPIDDQVTDKQLKELLNKAIASLPHERQRGVIRLLFNLDGAGPKTLDEVGEVYGVTRERIRQIRKTALGLLRHPSRSQPFYAYIGWDDPLPRPRPTQEAEEFEESTD
ncbi:MAG TPA: sigma-70 family RNA polymerase sigma factor [Candidatus Saccharimonadales bacterium]|nr:sigma-70 family RNA polymerase sigma factor [Candidatus Saccharimonadales bacterium]